MNAPNRNPAYSIPIASLNKGRLTVAGTQSGEHAARGLQIKQTRPDGRRQMVRRRRGALPQRACPYSSQRSNALSMRTGESTVRFSRSSRSRAALSSRSAQRLCIEATEPFYGTENIINLCWNRPGPIAFMVWASGRYASCDRQLERRVLATGTPAAMEKRKPSTRNHQGY